MNGARRYHKIDWVIVGCYLFLLIFGWMNIYASSLSGFEDNGFDWSSRYGQQIIWIGTAIVIDLIVLFFIPSRFYNVFAWWIYAFTLFLLAITIFLGKEINGSHSWLVFGPFRIQPAEFSKIAVALALGSLMEKYTFSFKNVNNTIQSFAILAIPMLLILLEKETGLMLVYAGFLFTFYREGMSGWILLSIPLAVGLFILTMLTSPYLAIVIWLAAVTLYAALYSRYLWRTILIAIPCIVLLYFAQRLGDIEFLQPYLKRFDPEVWLSLFILPVAGFLLIKSFVTKKQKLLRKSILAAIAGITLVISCDFAFNTILQDHQRVRIEQLLGMKDDPMGAGYNVHQSMIAIGSGGFHGKGFTEGTQTRFDFVPEQSTDFIFCTVGEEWGFLGALAVLICYGILIIRLYNSAEKQRSRFARVYGYNIASCILMHVTINIGMTIGLMPVIGIPLPMLSYGGSSLWCFSILLFIYLRMCYESDY